MNVVQVPRRFTPTHWGGTETYILEVSKRLLRQGHGTSILCPDALSDKPREILQQVPVKRVPYFYPYLGLRPEARRQMDLSGGSLFSFHLMKELWAWPKLDLIHLHTGRRPGAIGRYVAMKRRIPYVVSVHGGVFDVAAQEHEGRASVTQGTLEWGKVLGWWVGARRVMDDAAAVICVGRKEYEETVARYPRKRVHYMPNGVDAERYATGDGVGFRRRHRIDPAAPVLLTVGRIDPQKNQKLLLEILPELQNRHPGAHAVIIGHVTNDRCHEELQRMADALPAGSVTLIPGLPGDSHELVDAYHAADCFVLPSVHEPFGIVILEAWAAGLPVVASRVGGIPGFVEQSSSGLLCDPHDANDFRRAISLVLDNPRLAKSMAERGQRLARADYSWDDLTARLVELYEEVRCAHPVRQ